MWHRRQAEWEKEQKARDKLMTEVLQGLQKQVMRIVFSLEYFGQLRVRFVAQTFTLYVSNVNIFEYLLHHIIVIHVILICNEYL